MIQGEATERLAPGWVLKFEALELQLTDFEDSSLYDKLTRARREAWELVRAPKKGITPSLLARMVSVHGLFGDSVGETENT